MKRIFHIIVLLLIAIVLVKCNYDQDRRQEISNSKEVNFEWLLGNWQRVNTEDSNLTYESWKKINDSEYEGVGFTLRNNDTISKELMKITESNGSWNLLVKMKGEIDFTRFYISDIQLDRFEAKNDTLDFPKVIQYWKSKERLNALVAADSLKLAFEFMKLD